MSVMRTAHMEWRKFINDLEANNADVYLNLWMKAPADNPTLVQGAFLAGFEAGFTARLFNGEQDGEDKFSNT